MPFSTFNVNQLSQQTADVVISDHYGYKIPQIDHLEIDTLASC